MTGLHLFGNAFLNYPSEVQAATTYEDNLLTDYGIPNEIIEVILENSLQSDGQTPAAAGKTPSNFTIEDVEQLTTISLAERTKNTNGRYASQPSATIADWVVGLVASGENGVTTAQDVYALNKASVVTSATGSLTTRELVFDSHAVSAHYQPPFNFLMQIVASAKSATTADLTGVASKITDASTAQRLLALFQTDRLNNLTELNLGNNNLSDLSFDILASTLFNTTGSQKITKLDLSNNNMTNTAETSYISPILANLSDLNLIGNNIKIVHGSLLDALGQVVKNNGKVDMRDGELSNDWNTIQDLMHLMNQSSSTITLGDVGANTLIDQSLSGNGQPIPNKNLITELAPQMNLDNVKKIIEQNKIEQNKETPIISADAANEFYKNYHDQLSDELIAELKKAAEADGGTLNPDYGREDLAVSDTLNFAPLNLDIGKTNSLNALALSYTLPANTQLTAWLSKWQSTKNSFSGELVLSFPTVSYQLSENSQIIASNSTKQTVTGTLTTNTVQLTVNPAERAALTAGATYHNVITWQISNTVTNPQ